MASASFEWSGTDVSGPCVRATGAVESTVTESVTVVDVETEDAGAAASDQAAWWRVALRRFLSLSEGPRWRGR